MVLSRFKGRYHNPFVPLYGCQQITSSQVLMIGMSNQDTPWTIEISLVLPLEVRYIGAVID